MKAEKQNKWLGIYVSLGLHGLMLALLIFSVSGPAMIVRDHGKLDFVWVSLAGGDHVASRSVMDSTPRTAPLAAIRADKLHDAPVIQKPLTESPASVQAAPRSADDHSEAAFPSVRTVVYASAGGHDPVSGSGGRAAASQAAPVYFSAYPLYRENRSPAYPEIARERGYEGVVLISAEIQADGRVGRAVVRQSSGYAILDQTAMKAVIDWKFEPAKKGGVPCKTWAELPIKFILKDQLSQS